MLHGAFLFNCLLLYSFIFLTIATTAIEDHQLDTDEFEEIEKNKDNRCKRLCDLCFGKRRKGHGLKRSFNYQSTSSFLVDMHHSVNGLDRNRGHSDSVDIEGSSPYHQNGPFRGFSPYHERDPHNDGTFEDDIVPDSDLSPSHPFLERNTTGIIILLSIVFIIRILLLFL